MAKLGKKQLTSDGRLVRADSAVYLRVAKLVATHRRNPFLAGLYRATLYYRNCYNNFSYAMSSNGEAWLVNRVCELDNRPILFDIGANVGDWSAVARSAAPKACIHCFEILPDIGEMLSERFAGDPHVHVNQIGLLDEAGLASIKSYSEEPALSGLYDFPHDRNFTWLELPVTTGDAYCRASEVPKINLMKIDTEGSEHLILAGFSETLFSHKVEVVQFEYGLASVQSKFLLADYYKLFYEMGYVVGKLYPNHVDFRDYDLWEDETFAGPNYVAVVKSRRDLVGKLGLSN